MMKDKLNLQRVADCDLLFFDSSNQGRLTLIDYYVEDEIVASVSVSEILYIDLYSRLRVDYISFITKDLTSRFGGVESVIETWE